MLRLIHSNRTEALLAALARGLEEHRRRTGLGPFEAAHLVVPNRNVEAYVKLGLARHLGAAANLDVHLLRRFSIKALETAAPEVRIFGRDELFAGLLAALLDDALLEEPALVAVRRYVLGAGSLGEGPSLPPSAQAARRFQLADELARLFDEYALSRPDMLAAWATGTTLAEGPFAPVEAWQRALYLRVFGPGGTFAARNPGATWLPFGEALSRARFTPGAFPGGVFVFGFSYVAPTYLRLFDALGKAGAVFAYTLNPTKEFWEDVDTKDTVAETPALRLWGKAGRDYVKALDALVPREDEDQVFVPAEGATLLARLQRDILGRVPANATEPGLLAEDDGSLRVLACPTGRREVEVVASEIWRMVQASEAPGARPLAFDEIAVVLHPRVRDEYAGHVRAVFKEAQGLPFALLDVAALGQGPVGEAVELLLRLPESRFTRGDVLSTLTHPAVAGAGTSAAAWTRAIARVGVFHGLRPEDHEGSYITEDVYNWEQGIARLALGPLMQGARAGDESPARVGDRSYFPEDALLGEGEETGRLVLALRSLLSDAIFARDLTATPAEWARFFEGYVDAYLSRNEEYERDRGRVLSALGTLRDIDTSDRPVPFTLAAALARRALGAVEGSAGGAGVLVSSFVPMRALPFRAIFLLGMGEGLFPAADKRSGLDLRQASLRAGDVSPREGEAYMFLEALLCARERFVISYVSRDEGTGDTLAPASVVADLLAFLGRGYVTKEDQARLVLEHPLRRYDDRYFGPGALPRSVVPEVEGERRALLFRRELEAHAQGPLGELDGLRLREELPRESYGGVARLLDLDPPPRITLGPAVSPGAPEAPADERDIVSLAALDAFLDDPVQGYATYRLGFERDDEDEGLLAENDEPFALEARARVQLARGALEARWCLGTALTDSLPRGFARLLARGEAPAGVLAERTRGDLQERLAELDAASASVLGGAGARILRLGRAREHDLLADAAPPLVLAEDARGHGVRTLEGRCMAIAGGQTTLVVTTFFGKGKQLDEQRVDRYTLRAFLQRAALVAAGLVAPGPFDVLLLAINEGRAQRIAFEALSQEAAHGYLKDLAADLVGEPHAYFLPRKAAVPFVREELRGQKPSLHRLVERARKEQGTRESFGPLRHAERYPLPDNAEALARRRFGLFVALREGDETPSSKESP